MRASVRAAFYAFNVPFEAAIPYLYQDVLGLVSIGVGILCDPVDLAYSLPLVHGDGTPATRAEIASEWMRIKSLGKGDYKSGNPAAVKGHGYAKPHTTLRLTAEGLRSTLDRKMLLHDGVLGRRFADFEQWPADAQLALHSWAWGVGPRAGYPKMTAALARRDFRAAAEEVMIKARRDDGKFVELHGLKPRNAANRQLLVNAAVVETLGWDPEPIHWPRDLDAHPFSEAGPDEPAPLCATEEPPPALAFGRFDDALAHLRGRYRAERDDDEGSA